MKRKSFIIFILLLLFTLSNISFAFADENETIEFPTKYDVWSTKPFTVKFNKQYDPASLEGKIYVTDKDNNNVRIKYTIELYNNSIIIEPEIYYPKRGYDLGEYILHIDKGIKATDGSILKHNIIMKFIVIK